MAGIEREISWRSVYSTFTPLSRCEVFEGLAKSSIDSISEVGYWSGAESLRSEVQAEEEAGRPTSP